MLPPIGNDRTSPGLLHAFKWSLLGEASSRLIGPAVFLVLARLLTPEDFGVVASATVVVSLCQAVADVGLGKALVQRRGDVAAHASAAFWIALAASLAMMALLLLAAPAIGAFFHEPRSVLAVRVLSLLVPLQALATVPTALLQRDLAFRELFWVRLATAGLPALASIPMALGGMGYWALVAGALAGQALQCITLWARNPWRPGWRFSPPEAAQLVAFGRWTALSALLVWSYAWLDSLIVARYLGSHDMGIYRIANTFVTMLFGLAFAPVLPVLYSLLSRSGHRRDRVARALGTTVRAIALVALPAGALIVLLSQPIEAVLFGEGWSGLAPVLAMLAASQAVAWLVGANGEAYRAIGRPDLEAWVMGLSLLFYLSGYLVAIRHGLHAFVATRAALVLVGLALQLYVAHAHLGLSPGFWVDAAGRPLVSALVAMALAAGVGLLAVPHGSVVVAAVIFVAAYGVLIGALERRNLAMLWKQFRGT